MAAAFNRFPTNTALGCVHCPPTRMLSASTMTAERQERQRTGSVNVFRPGIALIAAWASLVVCPGKPALGGFWRAGLPAFRSPGGDHRAGGGEPLHGPRHRGVRPGGVFYRRPSRTRCGGFRGFRGGGGLAFPQRGRSRLFVAHPDIYGPQYGGYDPIDLARGVTVAGNPRFWLISGQRLYLFGREQTRDSFALDPSRVLQSANLRWPELEQTLAE